MISYDPKYMNYSAPIPYLISRFIYEYDISKANINILYSKGIISEADYYMIKDMPKEQRQVYVGILQKDRAIAESLQDGLAYYRKQFIEANDINDTNLLSVKNDAFFLIDTIPKVTKFGKVEFVRKNLYTAFYKLGKNLEVFYYCDRINEENVIDVKGINDTTLELHMNYMLSFLCEVFEMIQTRPMKEIMSYIQDMYNKYISRQLDIGFYREFNADSKFLIRATNLQSYRLSTITLQELPYIDISYNMNIFREIYSIVSTEYFRTVK